MADVTPVEIPAGSYTFSGLAAGPDDGRMVFLLHGFPQTARMWRAQLAALGDAGYRVVAPDQRGYARRARPGDVADYGVDHLVSDVLAMADWYSANQIDLVGHDWGAAVAWQVAARYPERLRSLTAISVPHPGAFSAALRGDADQQEKSGYIRLFQEPGHKAEQVLLDDGGRRLRGFLRGLPDDVAAEHAQVFLDDPGALTGALNWYRAMTAGRFSDPGPVPVPTLFVWSTGDLGIGRAAAEACAAHVTGPFTFEVLDGITHWVPEEAADRVNQVLLAHLAATG